MPPAEPPLQLKLFDFGPDMAKLKESAAAWRQHTRAALTHKAYDSDWAKFGEWCRSAGRVALPASGETLALFVADRLGGGKRCATASRAIAAVSHHHRLAGEVVPDRTAAREIVRGARRQRKEKPRQKLALTPAAVRQACKGLAREGTAEAARTRVVLTLGLATGLRRSNLAGLDVADLAFVARKGVAVTVRSGKRDQEGRGQAIAVHLGVDEQTCPVRALRAWLKYRGAAAGPLLTRVREGGVTLERLTGESISDAVKQAAGSIGLDLAGFSAHSLRAGFVTAARLNGTDVLGIMEVTGHKRVEQVRDYFRNADPFAGRNPLQGVL